jgi:hypothetical protein
MKTQADLPQPYREMRDWSAEHYGAASEDLSDAKLDPPKSALPPFAPQRGLRGQ